MGRLMYAKLLSVGLVPIPEASATVINAFQGGELGSLDGLLFEVLSRLMLKMDDI